MKGLVRGFAVHRAWLLGLSCLVAGGLLTFALLPISEGQADMSAEATPPAPWVWLEAEDFAISNFPFASLLPRGVYCDSCSGDEYLLFLPHRASRPFDPPGYWYADFALHAPQPGDYRYVWMSFSPGDAPFSWTVDGQQPLTATFLQVTEPYGDLGLRWAQLDPTGLDLYLNPDMNPHTFSLRRGDPDAHRLYIDAIVLTADETWIPSGTAKPPVDRSYLEAYPDYAVYARSWMEHILPDTVPEPDEITDTLWTFAAPGESEPLTFAVYARRPLTDVTVAVGDLTQDGLSASSVITAGSVDIRTVRVVTKRLDARSDPDETELVPEILDYNTPQSIAANSSKQYWLTFHVPPEAAPGDYRGTVTIAASNAPTATLDLTLTVLPFALLESPDRSHSIGHTPLLSFDGVAVPGDPFVYVQQDLADLRAHGMDAGSVYTPVSVTLSITGEVLVDYSDFERHMDTLTVMGFDGPAHWRGVYQLPRDLQALGVTTDTLETVYVDVVRTVLERADEKGWPDIYFFPVDEPFGHAEKEAELYWLAPLIKQVPGALVEVSLDGVETLPPEADPLTDVRFYNGWAVDQWLPVHTFEEIAADARASGDRLGYYYNTRGVGGRPEFSRVTFGLYAWNSPFPEQGVWTYRHFVGDPYDDTDGATGDTAYAYPDPERNYAPTLPTLRWEGVREGVDDLRYLYTLEQAMDDAQGNPAKAQALAQAQVLLDRLEADLNGYGPEARAIIAYFEPEDYHQYRWDIAQAIEGLGKKSPPPPRIYLPVLFKSAAQPEP